MTHGMKLAIDHRAPAAVRVRLDALSGLCVGIIILAAVAVLAGLFYDTGGESYEVVTSRGATVEIDGSGLYRNDSIFKAGANRGSDVLTLAVGIPLLAVAALFYRRGSVRGTLVLIGALAYFLYVYASMSLGTAYNGLFLLYVALFSGSLIALILAFRSVDTGDLTRRLTASAPRRFPGWFMIASGLVTLGVWLMDPLTGLMNDADPEMLETGTTMVTHALDIAIIVPAAVAAGWLILRGVATGYVLAMSLLILEIMLAPMIALQTVFQREAGVTFTTAEMIGPIGGFVVIALLAVWVTTGILRIIDDRPRLSGTS